MRTFFPTTQRRRLLKSQDKIDERQASLKSLIALGKSQGYLIRAEANEALTGIGVATIGVVMAGNTVKRLRYLPLGIVVASALCSLAVRLFGRPDLRALMGIPALLLTAWAFFEYLVTLGDDAPGGWSNPEGSRQFWYRSLLQLAVLLALFGFTCWIVAS